MKFFVDRDEFTEAVSWTARSLSPRTTVPVLGGLLIRAAEDHTITLSGFDYETSARTTITSNEDEYVAGTALVNGRLLADITRTLPKGSNVEVEIRDNKLHIGAGQANFNLALMPVGEYPELPAMPSIAGSVDGHEFARAVSQVSIAASKDDTLPILTGVRMEIEGDTITLLATDRYRLALRDLKWEPADPSISTAALVKAKTMSDVAKTLGAAGNLQLALSDTHELIGFESGSRRTTSVLVDGEYPKIRSLFPENTPVHAVVRKADLLDAARRVSLVAERNTPVRLAFVQGSVTLDAGTGEEAQATETINGIHLNGDDITVAFNPSYLSEGLSSFDSEFVRFSFTHPTKPVVVSAQDNPLEDDKKDYLYLLMPIRLQNQ